MPRKTLEKKKAAVEKLETLLKKYSVFAIADLRALKANQLQVLRKKFKDDLEICVAKNTLIKRALRNLGEKFQNLEDLDKYLTGQNALILSNKNPFSLYLMFEKNKVPSSASPGDIAPTDIVVSAGNTGLQPGPILSKFGAAKIPTKIQDGSVWIAKDTVVVKKDEVISADLADLLNKLGLKPIMVGIKLKMAYDGVVIPGDLLSIDLERYRSDITTAVQYALNLSLNTAYPTKETVPLLLAKAYNNAKTLAVRAGIPLPETIREVLSLAELQSRALADAISKKHPDLSIN
ncbi:MAG: 50S ribosomal protein L10 [Candidatus Methanomethyliaceae archaeon]|nr:50S ribosomal protein L10 [Candidatus Methanomethyliaceae archaeon]